MSKGEDIYVTVIADTFIWDFFFFNSGTETPWSLLKEDPVTCKTELVSSDRCRSTLKSQPKVP